MEWPQITIIVLWTICITKNSYENGIKGFAQSVIGTGIVATILHYGGFWG